MDDRYQRGTILCCPADECGCGLYRIVEPATFEDLVIFDDKVLRPLNDPIPLEKGEGTMEFCGQFPHLDCVGHLCTPCWTWRDILRADTGIYSQTSGHWQERKT